jgi:spermidine synthase
MIPWEHLGSAAIPGGGELRLMRRGAEYSIMTGAIELMNTRLFGSEVALAELAIAKLGGPAAHRILIGGLGMGFTLRAALKALPQNARVSVAELVPEVIDWARGPLAHVFEGSLDDPRVELIRADVGDLLAEAAAKPYDAVLLDVDNGAGSLNGDGNDRLYSVGGIAAARRAIRHGGVLAVWSAGPDQAFAGRMRRGGFAVDERTVRASSTGKGARHVIWLGTAR